MTSRQSHAASQPVTSPPLRRKLLSWLVKGLVFFLLVIGLLLLFVGLEKWRRNQEVLDKLGNDPIMSKTLLGMRFIKQEIKVDDVLFNWKPTSPELINYFQIDGDQQEIFNKLVNFAKENEWTDLNIYSGDNEDLRFSARKLDFTIHVRVYPRNMDNFRVYIKNQ